MPAIVYASSLGSREITYRGTFAYANLGMDLSLAGDFNGDGIGDFLIGAAWTDLVNDARGATYVLFGRPGNAFGPVNLDNMTAEQGFVLAGPDTGAITGEAVSSAGDVNGDGFDDLIVGVSRAMAASCRRRPMSCSAGPAASARSTSPISRPATVL